MSLSIVIPTLNEEKVLPKLLTSLLKDKTNDIEIIVVDGGSTDNTKGVAENFEAEYIALSKSSRANQMNAGASVAKGSKLLFLHADVEVPQDYFLEVDAILKHWEFGCFSYIFDSKRRDLKVMTWFNQFKGRFVGGGDQGLFVSKEKFLELEGFRPVCCIMEDFDFKERAIKRGWDYSISQKRLLVSPRKYDHNSFARVWVANTFAFSMFALGFSYSKIKKVYQSLVRSKY